jgi:hypothetical protein
MRRSQLQKSLDSQLHTPGARSPFLQTTNACAQAGGGHCEEHVNGADATIDLETGNQANVVSASVAPDN